MKWLMERHKREMFNGVQIAQRLDEGEEGDKDLVIGCKEGMAGDFQCKDRELSQRSVRMDRLKGGV